MLITGLYINVLHLKPQLFHILHFGLKTKWMQRERESVIENGIEIGANKWQSHKWMNEWTSEVGTKRAAHNILKTECVKSIGSMAYEANSIGNAAMLHDAVSTDICIDIVYIVHWHFVTSSLVSRCNSNNNKNQMYNKNDTHTHTHSQTRL